MMAHARDTAPTAGRPRPRWLAPVILAAALGAALGAGLAFDGIVSLPVVLSVAASGDMLLMRTARGEDKDRVTALTIGADDYMAKPFSVRELVARAKAMLRRQRPIPGGDGRPGRRPDGLESGAARRLVRADNVAIDLTVLELNLLTVVAASPGVIITRATLLDRIGRHPYTSDDHLVHVHVANLRRKLRDDAPQPRFVETVRGFHYRMREDAP